MDKLRPILILLRKYHFWLLCIVAIGAGFFGWFSARGTLSAQYDEYKSNVTGKFQALQTIQQDEFPPNETWQGAIAELTKQERVQVAKAWQTVYDAQQKVLAWPDFMPPDFKRWIKNAKPDAEFPDSRWLNFYQTEVIKQEFPKLAAIVEAKPVTEDPDAKQTATPASPPAEEGSEQIYKVVWENQDVIRKSLDFGGHVPTSLEVRLRQEDLWVLQALLHIIAKTNQDSLYTSRVKRIEDLAIGSQTTRKFADVMKAGRVERIASTEGQELAAVEDPSTMMGGEGTEAPPPDEGRYVDEQIKPQSAGLWKEQQFKRMPVYMRVVMDQRELTRLLTECANYPLPVEVRQWAINPQASSGSGETRASTPTRKASEPSDLSATAANAFDVTVEIYGIIYIYNPPDPTKLGADPDAVSAG